MPRTRSKSTTAAPPPLTPKELKDWRTDLAWTQRGAADWLGVGERTYENWESGHRNPHHPAALRARMEMAPRKNKVVRNPRKVVLVSRGKRGHE